MQNTPLLDMQNITKRFAGAMALDHANLRVAEGEVHALAGQNGAGKSTLIKIISGGLAADSGTIRFGGQDGRFNTPQTALRAGIATIHQELMLVPYASIAENLFLGRFPRRLGRIDWPRVRRDAIAAMQKLGLDVDVTVPLTACPASLRQMTAIARAVSEGARLVIMDEPSSSLDDAEVDRLLTSIRKLKADGVATLYITHRLDEVYAICDRVTVLRDGRTVLEGPLAEVPKQKLIVSMIGRDLADGTAHARPPGAQAPWLSARALGDGRRLRSVSVDLRAGEVTGLAGLLGSGRSETARALFGDLAGLGGNIAIDGLNAAVTCPRVAIRLGIGFCGEERKIDGILPLLSVRDNLTIAMLPRLSRAGVVNVRRQRAIVEDFMIRFNIKARTMDQPIRELSGGNQQKVLLARWIAMNPRLLILDEPTRGIDVEAKAEIRRMTDGLAGVGMSILLVSSDLEDLIGQAQRVHVLHDGRDAETLVAPRITEDALVQAITHATHAALRPVPEPLT